MTIGKLTLNLCLITLFYGSTASVRALNETLVGSDEDSYGCIPSAGYTWCESLQSCIQSFETNCTVIVGDDKPAVGGNKPAVGGNKPAVGGDKPAIGGDKPAIGGDKPALGGDKPAVGDIFLNESKVGSDEDSYGCIPSAGYTWCESLQSCIRSFETNCTAIVESNATSPDANTLNDANLLGGANAPTSDAKILSPAFMPIYLSAIGGMLIYFSVPSL